MTVGKRERSGATGGKVRRKVKSGVTGGKEGKKRGKEWTARKVKRVL